MTNEPTPAHEQPAATTTPSTAIAPVPDAPALPTAPTPETQPTGPAPDWNLRVDYLLLALMLVLAFFLASFTATNSDLWMHFATGKRISEGTFEFGVDPYSWATETGEQIGQQVNRSTIGRQPSASTNSGSSCASPSGTAFTSMSRSCVS